MSDPRDIADISARGADIITFDDEGDYSEGSIGKALQDSAPIASDLVLEARDETLSARDDAEAFAQRSWRVKYEMPFRGFGYGITPLVGQVDRAGIKRARVWQDNVTGNIYSNGRVIGAAYRGINDGKYTITIGGKKAQALENNGNTWLLGISGPAGDALRARTGRPAMGLGATTEVDGSNRVGRVMGNYGDSYVPGAPKVSDIVLAPDNAGRPQIFATTATAYRQISYIEEGVGGYHRSLPGDEEYGEARIVARRAGGLDLYAGWNGPLADAANDGNLYLWLAHGESTSCGFQSSANGANGGLVTVQPPSPGGVLCWSPTSTIDATGVRVAQDTLSTVDTSRFAYTVNAAERSADDGVNYYGETGALVSATLFREFTLRRSAQVIVAATGRAGRTYAQLKKGTNPYAWAMAAVDALIAKAIALGKIPRVPFITFVQGINQFTDSQATYAPYLDELVADFNTDIKAKMVAAGFTGHPDIYLIVDQIDTRNGGSRISGVALAQLERGLNNALIICAGSKFDFNYPDSTHPDARGYMKQAGMHWRAAHRTVITGRKFKPLYAPSAVRSGQVITVTFESQDGATWALQQLAIKDQSPGNHGITARLTSTDALLTITKIVFSGLNMLITLSADPGAQVTVGIATEGSGNSGAITGPCTDIADTDRVVHPFTGEILFNRACHQWIVTAS